MLGRQLPGDDRESPSAIAKPAAGDRQAGTGTPGRLGRWSAIANSGGRGAMAVGDCQAWSARTGRPGAVVTSGSPRSCVDPEHVRRDRMVHRLTRADLHELVWSEPLASLAPRFGVSGVTLAKTCRGAGIPVPERGYWARQRAGKPVRRRALPPRFPGAPDTIVLGGAPWSGWPLGQDDPSVPLPPRPTGRGGAAPPRGSRAPGAGTTGGGATGARRVLAGRRRRAPAGRRDPGLRRGGPGGGIPRGAAA